MHGSPLTGRHPADRACYASVKKRRVGGCRAVVRGQIENHTCTTIVIVKRRRNLALSGTDRLRAMERKNNQDEESGVQSIDDLRSNPK